jgi:hypothetical protein
VVKLFTRNYGSNRIFSRFELVFYGIIVIALISIALKS